MLGVRHLPGLPLLDSGGLVGLDVGPGCQVCVSVLLQLDHLLVIPLGIPVDLQAPVGKSTLRAGLDLRPAGLAYHVFLLAAVDGGVYCFMHTGHSSSVRLAAICWLGVPGQAW